VKDRFDLIIFDWDGTLVDSIDWIVHCLQTAAAENACKIPGEQAAKDIIGLSIDKAMEKLFPQFHQQKRLHFYGFKTRQQ